MDLKGVPVNKGLEVKEVTRVDRDHKDALARPENGDRWDHRGLPARVFKANKDPRENRVTLARLEPPDPLEAKACRGFRACKESPDPKGRKDRKEIRVFRAFKASRELKALKVRPAPRDHRDPKV